MVLSDNGFERKWLRDRGGSNFSAAKSRNIHILSRNGRNVPDLGRNGSNIPDLGRNGSNIHIVSLNGLNGPGSLTTLPAVLCQWFVHLTPVFISPFLPSSSTRITIG